MIGNKETFVNQIIGQATPDGHQITSFDTENLFTYANLNVKSPKFQAHGKFGVSCWFSIFC